jgi:hypothetical protein
MILLPHVSRCLHVAFLLGLVGLCPHFCSAADDKDGPTYTSRESADPDYAFQGEYRGYQRPRESLRSSESVAIQVIALGEGKFGAVKYYGGLPGEGWRKPRKFDLTGTRSADSLTLLGENYDAQIIGSTMTLFAKDGRAAGELQRIERVSPTMGAKPPAGAIVLFDGTGTSQWKKGQMTPDGLLKAGTETVNAYNNFRLHGEFMLPYKPLARGQNRGNSGFYLQGRYEVQVLDSFGLEGIENECGSLYRTKRPDTNLCLPPLQWQTYDIDFSNAKFDAAGKKTQNMRITVWHNGVTVHDSSTIPNKTGAGLPEGPQGLPIKLQEHGNPVVYRNIWLIDKDQPGAESIPWIHLPIMAPPAAVGN